MSRIFDLSGLSADHKVAVREALGNCDYPFRRLRSGLLAAAADPNNPVPAGREKIMVATRDLSRMGRQAIAKWSADSVHFHVHDNGDTGHVLMDRKSRARVLGLAWYSGKVELDSRLSNPEAQVVFLAEGAHMIDFFDLKFSPEVRTAIFAAFHPDMSEEDLHTHGHGWFEETGNEDYWSWVGEAFMDGFIAAFSTIPVQASGFAHPVTAEIATHIRVILTKGVRQVFGEEASEVFHDHHRGVSRDVTWPNRLVALANGRRPCGVCRP